MADAIRPEETADQSRNLIVFPGGGRMDPVQETPERGRELAYLIVWRLIGHGLEPPASAAAAGRRTRCRAYRWADASAFRRSTPSTPTSLPAASSKPST